MRGTGAGPRPVWVRRLLALATALLAVCAPAASAASIPSGGGSAARPSPHLPPLPSPLVGSRPVRLHSTKPPYTGALEVPEVVWPGHEETAARVDAAIDAWVAAQVRTFAGQVEANLRDAPSLPASLPPSSLTITFHVAELNARVASFRLVVVPFFRGEASPAQIPAGLSFDLATGKRYTLSSLFRPRSDYLAVLARRALTGLRGFRPAGARCYVGPGGPPASSASFAAWTLSPRGLELAFPAGQYTAAYCGPPVVTVPLSALRALAAPHSPLSG